MKRISCIIFDLDGTLTQTSALIYATFNYVAEKYLHKNYTPSEIIEMFGPTEEVAVEKIVGKEQISTAIDDFYRFYEANHQKMAQVHRGMYEILEYLKKLGIILTLFTGKGKRTTFITLEKFRLKQYFDLIVTGDDVQNHKPSADGIRRIMGKFTLNPGQVLMVGDSVADLKAAREGGVLFAAVLWDSYGKEKICEMDVDLRFDVISEFFQWLKSVIPINGKAGY